MIETLSNPKVIDLSVPVLNEHWVFQRFSRQSWHSDNGKLHQLKGVRIRHVWREKKRTTILYQLFFNEEFNHPETTYVGYLVAPHRYEKQRKQVMRSVRVQPPFGPAVIEWPDQFTVLLAFPNDCKIPLIQPEDVHRWLRRKRSSLPFTEELYSHPEAVIFSPLRFVPGKRYTVRCTLKQAGNNGSAAQFNLVIKQLNALRKVRRLANYLDRLQAATREAQQQLRSTGFSGEQRHFLFPRSLGLIPSHKSIVIEYLPGKNLKQLLGEPGLKNWVYSSGKLLARFHLLPVRVGKYISLRTEMEENNQAGQAILQSLPSMHNALDRLQKALARTASAWKSKKPVLLHGSFRLNHIFLSNGFLVLLDLDSLRMGSPAYDLANMLSSLYYLQAQDRIDAEIQKELTRSFLTGYDQGSEFGISSGEVSWYLISLLINKQAFKYVNHFHSDREAKVEQMLVWAEQIAARTLEKAIPIAEMWKHLP